MNIKSQLGLIALAAVASGLALAANAQVGGGYPSTTPLNSGSSSATSEDFNRLDANRDGYISKSEAKKDKELSKIFDSLDTNHDGKLDPNEFASYGGASSSGGGSMDSPTRNP